MTHKLFYVNILDSENISIESLSFSTCGNFLSVSYSNNISIYEIKSRFHLKTLNDSDVDASFRSIIWVPFNNLKSSKLADYRLFSIGLHGIIVEWDLRSFKQKRLQTSFGGAIFSGIISPFSDLMVTCDDGCVRSFTIWASSDDSNHIEHGSDELVFNKVLVKHSCSILSICCSKENFFCGTANSQILICTYDSRNYKTIKVSNSSNGSSNRPSDSSNTAVDGAYNASGTTGEGGGDCNIWSLVHVDDKKVLISGDSLGNVSVWDLSTLTMLQTFSDNKKDVISLVLINSNLFISASLQGKVVLYSYNSERTNDIKVLSSGTTNSDSSISDVYGSKKGAGLIKDGKWFINGFKYPLKGSIHCLSVYTAESGTDTSVDNSFVDDVGFLVCGGDFGCIYSTKTHKFLNNKTCKLIYPVLNSFNSHVQMNRDKSILISQNAHDVNVWSLSSIDGTVSDSMAGTDECNKLNKSDRSLTRSSKSGLNSILKNKDKNDIGNSSRTGDSSGVEKDICKLCLIKLNREGGRILESRLSPNGDVLAVLNESGLRILVVNNMKISQVKFSYNHLSIITMSFLLDNELLIHYYDKKSTTSYCISRYSINDGTMEVLDYLNMNESVIRMVVLEDLDGVNTNSSGSDDDGNSECNDSKHWGILYCLDNEVYCVDFKNKQYLKLPQIVNSRIVSVTINRGYLLAFSSSFKYYIYDLSRRVMVDYRGEVIKKIPSKVTNVNSLIVNTHWIRSWVIVQTTHNIFYFKLSGSLDSGTSSGGAVASTSTKGSISSFKRSRSVSPIRTVNSKKGKSTGCIIADNIVNMSVNMVNSTTGAHNRISNSFSNKASKLIIGPRRLYNVPSIEHYVYANNSTVPYINNDNVVVINSASGIDESAAANDNTSGDYDNGASVRKNSNQGTNTNSSTNRSSDIELLDSENTKINYVNLVKNKFIVHSEVLISSSGGNDDSPVNINIIAFKKTFKDDFVRSKKYGQ